MKTSIEIALLVIALALLACLVWLRTRPDEPFDASSSDTSLGPSFQVRVVRPLSARPFFGLFGLIPDNDLRFDHTSHGAEASSAGQDRLSSEQQFNKSRFSPSSSLKSPVRDAWQ